MNTPYKTDIYNTYRSHHNDLLYGRPTLESITRGFKVWHYYYSKHLPESNDANILDVGCGEGAFVFFLRHAGYRNVEGIDISAEQISLGQELGIGGLIEGDLREHLENAREKYDLIVARDVMEHFTRAETFTLIKLIFASLKPGGIFLMQVPNGVGIFMASIFFGDFTHETAFSDISVRQLFLKVGFKSSACFPVGPAKVNFKGRVRSLLWQIRVACHRFWKWIETGNSGGIFTSNLIAVGRK